MTLKLDLNQAAKTIQQKIETLNTSVGNKAYEVEQLKQLARYQHLNKLIIELHDKETPCSTF